MERFKWAVPVLTAGGALGALARLLLWPPLPPPLLDEADEVIDPAWQAAALAAHLEEHQFRIPSPGEDDGPGETSTNSAGDWYPTPHGLLLGEALAKQLVSPLAGKAVIELGAGVGNHSVLIHRMRPARLALTELSQERLVATRRTMAANGCGVKQGDEGGESIEYLVADWLQAAGGPYDALVTNPPFAQSGKYNRRYFIDELILNAHKLLAAGAGGGTMVFVQSSAADIPLTMRRLEENGWEGARIVLRRDYPWRRYYFADATYVAEADALQSAFEAQQDLDPQRREEEVRYCYKLVEGRVAAGAGAGTGASGRRRTRVETIAVIEARLKPYAPVLHH